MAENEMYDPIARMHAQARARQMAQGPAAPLRQNYWENARYPLSFVLAFVIGILATALARYCQFHMLGLPAQAEDADMQLVMDNIFAGLVAVVIRLATNFATAEHMTAKFAGVWVAIVMFHNLSHWAPEQMATVFSRDYVKQVQAQTDGNSILFRGQEFYFGDGPVKISVNR